MPSLDPSEALIIRTAHEFVQTWLRGNRRRPFAEAVRIAERRQWDRAEDSDREREAFRKVANAIRIGIGHIDANPRPLIEIVRRVMPR